jgi:hypothetical protein
MCKMDQFNAFIGKTSPPVTNETSAILGAAGVVWLELIESLASDLGVTLQEWKSSSPKYGWTLILSVKKRRIVYLTPGVGCFRASFILGERAVSALRESKPSKKLLQLLDEAPHYPEGTGVRLTVKNSRDLAVIRKLAKFKLEN